MVLCSDDDNDDDDDDDYENDNDDEVKVVSIYTNLKVSFYQHVYLNVMLLRTEYVGTKKVLLVFC